MGTKEKGKDRDEVHLGLGFLEDTLSFFRCFEILRNNGRSWIKRCKIETLKQSAEDHYILPATFLRKMPGF